MKLAKPEDLQVLERILHQRLQSEFTQADRLKVGCAIGDDGALVILSQHPPQVNLDADRTFTAIGQALQSLRPQAVQSVRLYLREAGQQQTYAKHDITLEPSEFAADLEVVSSPVSPVTSEELAPSAETESSVPEVETPTQDSIDSLTSGGVVDEMPLESANTAVAPLEPTTNTVDETPLEPANTAVAPLEPTTNTVDETPLEPTTATEQPEIQLEPTISHTDSLTSDRDSVIEIPAEPISSSAIDRVEQSPIPSDAVEVTEITSDRPTIDNTHPISSPPPSAPHQDNAPAAVNREDIPVQMQIAQTSDTTESPSETWRSLPFEQRLETVAKPDLETSAESTTETSQATLPYPVLPLQRLPKPSKSKIPHAALLAGGGAAIVAFFGGTYVLSSPCTIGRCQQLETATQLHQESNRIVRGAKERAELADAEKQLKDANNLLKQIPPWSSRHREAQNLSSTIANRAAILDRAQAALEEGDTAANKLKQPIRSLEDWRAIQALWQRAIASLSAIPQDSELHPLAQRKITEYRGNLQAIEQKMQSERQAFQKIPQAQNLARTAQQQQLTARSLQAWQTVRTNWQEAVNALSAIPQSSTVYQQAQQLLAQYRPQLKLASDRAARESSSAKAFSQAMNAAELAERSTQQGQFAAAQTNLKQALGFVQQIPSGTQYYDQAQSLVNTYTTKLEQIGTKAQDASVTQKVRADLDRACSGRIRVCRYKLDNKQIFVQLTSSYEQAVEKTFINARLRGDSKAQANIAAQYRTLKQVLEGVSNDLRLPLRIYASDGGQMHSYKPKE